MLLREALEQVRQSHPLPVAFHTSASTAEALEWLHAGNRAVAAEPSEFRQAQQDVLAWTCRWMGERMREVPHEGKSVGEVAVRAPWLTAVVDEIAKTSVGKPSKRALREQCGSLLAA